MIIIKSQRCPHIEEHRREHRRKCPFSHEREQMEQDVVRDEVDTTPSDSDLNEVSPENEETEETPNRTILVRIVGDPSGVNIEDILSMIEQVLPVAEKSGLDEETEKVRLAASKLRKMAEYEGWGVYWIANGRAFEKSYKKKKEEKGDAPNAATEAWMETLEEYQEALMKGAFDFTEKYASKKDKNKAEEEAMGGGGTGGGAAIMGPGQIKRYKRLKELQEKEGVTEGEALSIWLDEQQGRKRVASIMLLDKISSRMDKGSGPGVSVYEALEELQRMPTEIKREALVELGNLYAQAIVKNKTDLKEVLAFGILDRLTSPFRRVWHGLSGGIGDFFRGEWAKGGSPHKKLRRIRERLPNVKRKLNEVADVLGGGSWIPAKTIQEVLDYKDFYKAAQGFMDDISKVVGPISIPNPANYAQNGYINMAGFQNFLADFVLASRQFTDENAKNAYYAKTTGVRYPDVTKMTYPEDTKLIGNIGRIVNYVNTVTNDLQLALPEENVVKVFDPRTVQAELDTLNFPSLMGESMQNLNRGEDMETEANRISSLITQKLDDKLENYIEGLRDMMLKIKSRGGDAKLMRYRERAVQQAGVRLRQAWEKSRLEIEQQVQKALSSRYQKLNAERNQLLGVSPNEPVAKPRGRARQRTGII